MYEDQVNSCLNHKRSMCFDSSTTIHWGPQQEHKKTSTHHQNSGSASYPARVQILGTRKTESRLLAPFIEDWYLTWHKFLSENIHPCGVTGNHESALCNHTLLYLHPST
ncbi:uncharacterized protein H6S33_004857 [Morchella sextelata]|uniref:uncharacterized protein n=1 Tax=Morchella sextelata TaxID=1174677 RepID=UPI001D0544EE|nr:uncharacterized protein H6S33_004857 [Morchella sextelata]KAH0605635.1 hypothetical protein H6S33_004857 [Morchella sextelata]